VLQKLLRDSPAQLRKEEGSFWLLMAKGCVVERDEEREEGGRERQRQGLDGIQV
jgi:hypothetical protein